MVQQLGSRDDRVDFEAVVPSEIGRSIFMSDTPLEPATLQECTPPAGRAAQAASMFQSLGFRVQQIGTFSISGDCPRELWERVFGTRVEQLSQPLSATTPELGEVSYFSHVANTPFSIPEELSGLVERAYPQRPPILFESPLPPRVPYHHLRVPEDVAGLCRSTLAHRLGVTGKGVKVAMVDSGFYKHPFYAWHGYKYNAILSPDAINLERDEVGHGTAEAANIFANAPDIDFIGVKWGSNSTLAFKTAADLRPAVITNSWGYDLKEVTTLPNFLKPLEAAIIEAVQMRGITVCFSAGNGQIGFPAMMPDVIAVGGVYAHDTLAGDDLLLEASNYASSFDSQIYPGRHVPDICGLVGMRPRAIYIMLPVEPNDRIDKELGGSSYPNKDETAMDDGWTVISGTSAASPQVAGICALLKQVQPNLSPAQIKKTLRASARKVKRGQSSTGQPAGEGQDGATGGGLVDAYAAYKLVQKEYPVPDNNEPVPSKETIAKLVSDLLSAMQRLRSVLDPVARDEQELRRLDSEWDDILMRKDIEAIDRLLADDYTSINPYGGVGNKTQEIAAMTSGDFIYESINTSEVNVRVYGNIGVVMGRLKMKGRYKGQEVSSDYRYTDVYVKRQERWQVVSFQATSIMPPQAYL